MIQAVLTFSYMAMHSALHGVVSGGHHGQHQQGEYGIRHRVVRAVVPHTEVKITLLDGNQFFVFPLINHK